MRGAKLFILRPDELVPDAEHRQYVLRIAWVIFYLLTEVLDVAVYSAFVAFVAEPLYVVQELESSQSTSRPGCQRLQQSEFASRELHDVSTSLNLVSAKIDLQIAHRNTLRLR